MTKKRQSRATKIVLSSLLAASLSVPSFASAKEAEETTVKATVVAQEDFEDLGYEEVTFETFKSGSDVAGYMDKYFEETGLLYEDEDGTYFVDLTVPVEFASEVQGFEVEYEGEYVEADFEEQEDGSIIITFPVDPNERTAVMVYVAATDTWYEFDFQPVLDEEVVEEDEESLATIPNPFSDIDNNENKEAILNLLALGIVKAQDKFNPTSNLTRAQFALMIARTLELKSTTDAGFQDVKGLDAERVSAINALAEYGIIAKRDKFNPNATLTRQQGALMIYRAIDAVTEEELEIEISLPYADVSTIAGDEAKKAFSLLNQAGIMTGSVAKDGKTYINANKPLTRGQMAKLLNNSLELFNEEEYEE